MQKENGATPPVNQQGGTELKDIASSINTIKDVVGNLVTKVSEIERRTQESQELERIMRSMKDDEEEPPVRPSHQRAPQQVNVEDMSKEQLASYIMSSVGGQIEQRLSALDKKLNDMNSSFEVKRLAQSDPEWNTKVRPVAYQLSKQPGFDRLSVEQLDKVARGNLALQELEQLKPKMQEYEEKLKELEVRASGDKPGFFVGMPEPEKQMNADEAFDDALRKSGLDKLMG